MKLLAALLLTVASLSATAQDLYLDYQAAYSPPGGDIIAGNQIARYVIEATPTVEYGYATLSARFQAYGTQDWVPKEVRGNGMDKFTGSYAWGVDDWRYTVTPRLELGNESASFFIENYSPIDRHGVWNEGRAHGQETEYYWLIGVSGRVRF